MMRAGQADRSAASNQESGGPHPWPRRSTLMSHGHASLGESTLPRSTSTSRAGSGAIPIVAPVRGRHGTDARCTPGARAKKGPMHADDDLSDPITLITDPVKSINNPDNPAMTAGFTFLGSFSITT